MNKKWIGLFNSVAIIILFAILIVPTYAYANGGGELFGSFFLAFGIIVVIFLICREIVCWYWKINQIVSLLTDIRQLLRSGQQGNRDLINSALNTIPSQASSITDISNANDENLKKSADKKVVTKPYANQTEWVCNCGTHNPLDKSKKVQNCSNCHQNRDFVLNEIRK
jgi:hypothetical protein